MSFSFLRQVVFWFAVCSVCLRCTALPAVPQTVTPQSSGHPDSATASEASGDGAAGNRRQELERALSRAAFEVVAFGALVVGGHRIQTAASPRDTAATRRQTQLAWDNFQRMANAGKRGQDFADCWLQRLLATPGFIQKVG
jgi:hypothetical protein